MIGGTAAVLYGVPRATFDLDVLIEATPENATALLEALRTAGFGTASLIDAPELLRHEITVFRDRYRIDVQTFTPGLRFADAWPRRIAMSYDGAPFYLASKPDLIASKRAAGRNAWICPIWGLDVAVIRLRKRRSLIAFTRTAPPEFHDLATPRGFAFYCTRGGQSQRDILTDGDDRALRHFP